MIRIEFPFDGAVLNQRLGRITGEGLEVEVCGEAPVGLPVHVNGVQAVRRGGRFEGTVTLRSRCETLSAVSSGPEGRFEHSVRVLWDRQSRPRYRFSIDDNSFFLRDLARTQSRSLFDCFYLRILQDLHREFGVKFVLNLFFSTPEDDFQLSAFSDRYRGEWEANSDWLKLAWHAAAEFPDRPYQYASPETVAGDFDRVAAEILRFAGEASYSPPTVVHWGMCRADALPVLRERGVRVLSGYFAYTEGQPFVNYHLDPLRCERLNAYDVLMDFASGLAFSKIDLVCNATPVGQTVPTLAPLCEDPRRAEIMDLFTHEQYFWPFYRHHVADHAERLATAIRFLSERGYEPVFFHEGFLGCDDEQ